MNQFLFAASFFLLGAGMASAAIDSRVGTEKEWTDAEIHAAWTSGETLPWNAAKKYPIPPVKVENDTGINVLVDLAHQCGFAMLWQLPPKLRQGGFRPCGSQASIDAVLAKGGYSRRRIPYAGRPPPFRLGSQSGFQRRYHVSKQSLNSQKYLPQEIEALKSFVENGGGLIIMGTRPPTAAAAAEWSLNHLAKTFGAAYTHERSKFDGNSAVLELSPEWEVVAKGDNGPARAQRHLARGGWRCWKTAERFLTMPEKDRRRGSTERNRLFWNRPSNGPPQANRR